MWTECFMVRCWYFNSFPQLVGWLYVPSEWHITTYLYFFAQERKKLLIKLPSRAIFAISKFPYSFRIAQLPRKFQFLSQIFQMVTTAISGKCNHEVNFPRVNSFNNISFITSTLRRLFSGCNMEYELNVLWFAPDTLIFFQNWSDGYMSRQSDI